MTLAAGPVLIVGIGAITISLFLAARSFFAYERELFMFRIGDVADAMLDAHERGQLQDSPRLSYLLKVASASITNVETITPLRIAAINRAMSGGQPRLEAPKADRAALDGYYRQMTRAWARLLILGSPSGWVWTAVELPKALVRSSRRDRQPKQEVQRMAYEQLVQPVDPTQLHPVRRRHRDRDLVTA